MNSLKHKGFLFLEEIDLPTIDEHNRLNRAEKLRSKSPEPTSSARESMLQYDSDTSLDDQLDFKSQVISILKRIYANPTILHRLKIFANATILLSGSQYTFITREYINNKERYFTRAVAKNKLLDRMLPLAQFGASFSELIGLLDDLPLSQARKQEFITSYINEQILETELNPTQINKKYLSRLIQLLDTTSDTAPLRQELHAIYDKLLNEEMVLKAQKKLPKDDTSAHVSNATVPHTDNVLLPQLEEYLKHAGIQSPCSQEMAFFKNAFVKKYGLQPVSLCEALDIEIGVGFGQLPDANSKEDAETWVDTDRQLLTELWSSSVEQEWTSVPLTLHDVQQNNDGKKLDHYGPQLSVSWSAVQQGKHTYFYIEHLSLDAEAELAAQKNRHTSEETRKAEDTSNNLHNSTFIFAELKTSTSGERATLEDNSAQNTYEIFVTGRSPLDKERQLKVSDLMIQIVDNDIIILSQKHHKQVILIKNHYEHREEEPILLQFLHEVAHQNQNHTLWNWRNLTDRAYLPRVTYKNLILSPAMWHLQARGQTNDSNITVNESINNNYIERFLEKWKVPKLSVIHIDSKKYIVDSSNAKHRDALKRLLTRHENIYLIEYFESDNLPENIGTNELPQCKKWTMLLTNTGYQQHPLVNTHFREKSIGNYGITEEWFSARIYTGPNTAELLLQEVVVPLTDELIEKNIITKWYFLRSNQPLNHLCLCFSGEHEGEFWHIIVVRLRQQLTSFSYEKVSPKIEFDLYNQEQFPFAVDDNHLFEDFACADSNAIAHFSLFLDTENNETLRWIFAIKNIDYLFSDFGYNLQDRIAMLSRAFDCRLHKDIPDDKVSAALALLAKKYKEEVFTIRRFLHPLSDIAAIDNPLTHFSKRSTQNRKILESLKSQVYAEHWDAVIEHQLSRYIESTINRILLSKRELHELTIYYFLMNYYQMLLVAESTIRSKDN